ncbi:unnamed protein product, partial [Oppiella nova]
DGQQAQALAIEPQVPIHVDNDKHNVIEDTVREEGDERPNKRPKMNKKSQILREKKEELERAAVIPAPKDASSYGEMGKPVVLTNISTDIQRKIDKGWESNAFNQYISDLISLERKLPDVRDPQYVYIC